MNIQRVYNDGLNRTAGVQANQPRRNENNREAGREQVGGADRMDRYIRTAPNETEARGQAAPAANETRNAANPRGGALQGGVLNRETAVNRPETNPSPADRAEEGRRRRAFENANRNNQIQANRAAREGTATNRMLDMMA